MLDIREIDAAIVELERREATFSGCAKLADLYTVRAHIIGQDTPYEQKYSTGKDPDIKSRTDLYGNSDFLKAVSGKDALAAWSIMDELMDTLHIVNPRVYDSVIKKIKAL